MPFLAWLLLYSNNNGTMAEILLQLENSIIKHHIDAKILSFYTRYVDDILLI